VIAQGVEGGGEGAGPGKIKDVLELLRSRLFSKNQNESK
jgi:hypothetical protein